MQSADNQQERLISIGWVIGFVDGEGCFSIGVVRQPHRINRRGYRTGYQLTHEFVVTQGARSVESLRGLKDFFGVGAVYRNTRYDNHREDLLTYNVNKRADLLRVVIPFFPGVPASNNEATGLREVCPLCGEDLYGASPQSARPCRPTRDHRDDE